MAMRLQLNIKLIIILVNLVRGLKLPLVLWAFDGVGGVAFGLGFFFLFCWWCHGGGCGELAMEVGGVSGC